MLAAISALPPAASSSALASFLPIPPIAMSDEIASSGYGPAAEAELRAAGGGAAEVSEWPEPGKEGPVGSGAAVDVEAWAGGGTTGGIGLPCLDE